MSSSSPPPAEVAGRRGGAGCVLVCVVVRVCCVCRAASCPAGPRRGVACLPTPPCVFVRVRRFVCLHSQHRPPTHTLLLAAAAHRAPHSCTRTCTRVAALVPTCRVVVVGCRRVRCGGGGGWSDGSQTVSQHWALGTGTDHRIGDGKHAGIAHVVHDAGPSHNTGPGAGYRHPL